MPVEGPWRGPGHTVVTAAVPGALGVGGSCSPGGWANAAVLVQRKAAGVAASGSAAWRGPHNARQRQGFRS